LILSEKQANAGVYSIYTNPNARSVSKTEVDEAKAVWKAFLEKLLAVKMY